MVKELYVVYRAGDMLTHKIPDSIRQNWKSGIVLVLALLAITVGEPYFYAALLALPTAIQLLLGMLMLFLVSMAIYAMLQDGPDRLELLCIAAILLGVVFMMGIAPVVTYWGMNILLLIAVIIAVKVTVADLLQKRRTA